MSHRGLEGNPPFRRYFVRSHLGPSCAGVGMLGRIPRCVSCAEQRPRQWEDYKCYLVRSFKCDAYRTSYSFIGHTPADGAKRPWILRGRVQSLELTPRSHVETMRSGARSAVLGPVSIRVMYLVVNISGRRGSIIDRPVSGMGLLVWASLSVLVQAGSWIPLRSLLAYCSLLSETCEATPSFKRPLIRRNWLFRYP